MGFRLDGLCSKEAEFAAGPSQGVDKKGDGVSTWNTTARRGAAGVGDRVEERGERTLAGCNMVCQ